MYRSATNTIESGANTIDEASVAMNNQIITKYGVNESVISRANALLLVEDLGRANNGGKLHAELKGDATVDADGTLKDFLDAKDSLTDTSFTLEYDYDSNGAIKEVTLTGRD